MKLSAILLIFLAGIAAIAAGWIYQSEIQTADSGTELEIPLDIDYYLSGVNYRVISKTGQLDYQLRSPYLEHYKREDLSRINTPQMTIYRNGQHWQAQARIAELLHQNDKLKLYEDVILERTGDKPLKLTTDLLSFDANSDIVTGENGVQIISDNAKINAVSAVFNLEQNIYSLSKASAVYYQ